MICQIACFAASGSLSRGDGQRVARSANGTDEAFVAKRQQARSDPFSRSVERLRLLFERFRTQVVTAFGVAQGI